MRICVQILPETIHKIIQSDDPWAYSQKPRNCLLMRSVRQTFQTPGQFPPAQVNYTWQLVNWIYNTVQKVPISNRRYIIISMNFVDKRMWCDIAIWHTFAQRACVYAIMNDTSIVFMSTQPFVYNFMISHNLSIGKPLKTSWYWLCVRGMCLSACASHTKTENAVLETSILCLSGTQNLL